MDDNCRSMKVRPTRFFFQKVRRYLADTNNSSTNQFVRYSFVGVLNTVIGYGAFFIFVNYIQYLIALGCAHIIGVINSYAWNHNWVFNRRLSIVEFIKFNAVYIIAFA